MKTALEQPTRAWRGVCRLSDILPDTGVCILAFGRQIALFRLGEGEALYALDNFDPFSGANVLSRGILGDRAGRPKVASPVYKQSFCLRTGQCLDDEAVALAVFDVRVCGDTVEIAEPVTRSLRSGNAALLSDAHGA
jgi:nitrite reductase (NADH) small subunit